MHGGELETAEAKTENPKKKAKRIAALYILLLDLFPEETIRPWLLKHGYSHIESDLPSRGTPTTELIAAVILHLDRRGEIDRPFFDFLVKEFPHKRERITRVARMWFPDYEGPSNQTQTSLDRTSPKNPLTRWLRVVEVGAVLVVVALVIYLGGDKKDKPPKPTRSEQPANQVEPPTTGLTSDKTTDSSSKNTEGSSSDGHTTNPVTTGPTSGEHTTNPVTTGPTSDGHTTNVPPPPPPPLPALSCPADMVFIKGPESGKFNGADVGHFCMDITEVTVRAYVNESVLNSVAGLRCNSRDTMDLPVNCVTMTEARRYCTRVNKRLPTEWEWEWAARGGEQARLYTWAGEPRVHSPTVDPPPDCPDRAMPACASGAPPQCNADREDRTPGTRTPNENTTDPYGLKDMAGNVWEWTDSRDAAGNNVLRGGAWYPEPHNPRHFRTCFRFMPPGIHRRDDIGFRCVVDPTPSTTAQSPNPR